MSYPSEQPGSMPPPSAPLPAPPAWGQPPPPPARKPGTNGFAVAALIFGVLGGVLFAVIFGIVGFVQTRGGRQKGMGLAIAGLALAGAWLVGFIALGIIVAVTSDSNSSSGTPTANDQVSAQSLQQGDCLKDIDIVGEQVRNLPVVPCAEPHNGEVFATFELGSGDFPGDAAVAREAEEGCVGGLNALPGKFNDENLEVVFLHPTSQSWLLGDHTVVCIATDSTGPRTGSLSD